MLNVFFDGGCPMCVREVAVYRRQSPADIHWHNLALPALAIPTGADGHQPDRAALLRRFHVLTAEGRWLSGAPAFTALWSRLGRPWRTLAAIGRVPGGLWVMDRTYDAFLVLRPTMQRLTWHLVEPDAIPRPLIAAIRSDQAGETGAVWIYRAMRLMNRHADIRDLLEEHARQEERHLAAINAILPWWYRSRLLPIWRVAGWTTGMIAALGGRSWTLATIAAVETFVDRHYQEQIDQLSALDANQLGNSGLERLACVAGECPSEGVAASDFGGYPDLLSMLRAFQEDELRHRADALGRISAATPAPMAAANHASSRPRGRLLAMWCSGVARGSALAVWLAKRI